MSILDYAYSPSLHGNSFVGRKIRDYVPAGAVRENDAALNDRKVPHQFEDSIGGDSSNYKEDENN